MYPRTQQNPCVFWGSDMSECTRMYPNVPECTPENPPNVPKCTPANPPNVPKYTLANPPNIMKLQKMPPHQTSRSTFPPSETEGGGFFLDVCWAREGFSLPSDPPTVRPTSRPSHPKTDRPSINRRSPTDRLADQPSIRIRPTTGPTV